MAHKQQAPVGNCNPDPWKYVGDFKCKHPRLKKGISLAIPKWMRELGTRPQSTHQLRNG